MVDRSPRTSTARVFNTTAESPSHRETRSSSTRSRHTTIAQDYMGSNNNTVMDQDYNALSSSISATVQCLSQVVLEGADPEALVTPLLHLKANLLTSRDTPIHEVVFDSGSNLDTLIDMVGVVGSRWLESQVEDILCWSYEQSAKRIR